jgi:hypothetical protein
MLQPVACLLGTFAGPKRGEALPKLSAFSPEPYSRKVSLKERVGSGFASRQKIERFSFAASGCNLIAGSARVIRQASPAKLSAYF